MSSLNLFTTGEVYDLIREHDVDISLRTLQRRINQGFLVPTIDKKNFRLFSREDILGFIIQEKNSNS